MSFHVENYYMVGTEVGHPGDDVIRRRDNRAVARRGAEHWKPTEAADEWERMIVEVCSASMAPEKVAATLASVDAAARGAALVRGAMESARLAVAS